MRTIKEINKLMKKKRKEAKLKSVKGWPDVKFPRTRVYVTCSKQENCGTGRVSFRKGRRKPTGVGMA